MLSARLVDEWLAFLPFGVLDDLAGQPGRDLASAGLLLACIYVGGLAGGVLVVAADHVSRRLLASLGAAGFGLSLAGFALPLPLWAAAIAAAGLGMSSDAMVYGCETALVDLAGDDLPRQLARQNFLASIGDFLGPLSLAAVLAIGLPWQVALWLGAAVAFVYAVVLAGLPLPPPSAPEGARQAVASVAATLRDVRVWAIAAIVLGVSALDEPFVGFAIARWRSDGAPAAIATLLSVAWVVGGLAGTGLLAVRRRTAPVALTAPAAALVVGVAGVALLPWWLSPPASALTGLATVVLWTTMQDRMLRLSPGRAGTTTAVVGYLTLPELAFPVIAGVLADRHGLQAALTLYLVVGVATAVAVVLAGALSAGRGR